MARGHRPDEAHGGDPSGLPWYQRLQTQFWLLFLLLIGLIGFATWKVGTVLILDNLAEDVLRYETESARRLQTRFSALADQAETLAAMLSELAAAAAEPANPTPAVPDIVNAADPEGLFVGVGIWPKPAQGEPRRSRLWLRNERGLLQAREDYNDPRVVSYTEASWFAVSRFTPAHRCAWSAVRREPLLDARIISCTVPLRIKGQWAGAVTVLIATRTLEALFDRDTRDDPGYSLLVDGDHRLLAVSSTLERALGESSPSNLAALAQRFPSLNPLALSLFEARRERVSALTRSPAYDAAQVSALAESTREWTREEAEAALAQLWLRLGSGRIEDESTPKLLQFARDDVLGSPTNAVVFDLPRAGWSLIRVRSRREGFSGAEFLFQQTLVVTGAGILIALLLISGALRWLVINPLRTMTRTLAGADRLEDSLDVALNESHRNELGVLARLYNERTRQLRQLMDDVISRNAQMTIEATQRREAEVQLALCRERGLALLQQAFDPVVVADAQGRIQEVNPAAEQWLGRRLSELRGEPFGAALAFELHGEPVPDLALSALERGQPLDYLEGLSWRPDPPQSPQPVSLRLMPVRGAGHQRVHQLVAIIHPLTGEPAPVTEALPMVDALTGLPSRPALERHLRKLLYAAQLQSAQHAVVMVDLDHHDAINQRHGTTAGDEVLQKIASMLQLAVEGAGGCYRLVSDEFALVLEHFDADRARIFCEALRQQVASTPFRWAGETVSMTASFGITVLDGSADSTSRVLREADDACEAAKRAGRNRVMLFQPEQARSGPTAEDDALWAQRIRAGLDQQRFHLTTQWVASSPAIAEEGQVFSLQASLEDEEGFWAEPAQFMPVAERYGLSGEIDRWILRQALTQLDRRSELREKLAFLRLDLAPSTLGDPGFLGDAIQLLAEHPAVKPSQIVLTLPTEALSRHGQKVVALCETLARLGVRFGAIHASFAPLEVFELLRRLPLSLAVIDAAHLPDPGTDEVAALLARQALELAEKLGQRCLVRGLDDASRLSAWQRLGAAYLKGMAVAKATPIIFTPPR